MKKLLSMALVLMMVLTLLAVPAMAADSINITEVNDYGTVVAEVGADTITVTADTGYYLYSATLNGTDILASMTAGYDDVRDSAVSTKETWTYTAAAPLTAADELVVTYGYYTTEVVISGDGDAALGTTGTWTAYSAGCVTIIPEPGNESNNVYALNSSRLRSVGTWTWIPGEKYMIKWEAKDPNYTGDPIAQARFYADSTTKMPNSRYYVMPEATADWNSYMTYVDVISNDSDYMYFQNQNASLLYYDNMSITRLTKAGKVPTWYDINVTEVNDYGVVTTEEKVAEGATTTIKVVPEEGYYLYSATINGTPVDFTQAYENYDSATAWGYKQVWTYTTAAATEDIDVAITYGYYIYDHKLVGGDAESSSHNVINYSNVANERTDVTASTGSYSFVFDGTRLKTAGWTEEAGEKYLIKWDLKSPSANGNQRVYGSSNGIMPNGRYYDYPLVSTDWKSYTTYFDVTTTKTGEYIYFQNNDASGTSYYDNLVVAILTEGGIVPVYCDINVTENADNGTVTVAEKAVQGTDVDVKIVADTGYYVDSVTVGGEEVELATSYDKTATATEYIYKEAYTFTIAAIAEDADIVVTYAAYAAEELAIGGDAESDVTNVTAHISSTNAPLATIEEVENGNHAFVSSSSAKTGIPRWNIVEGEKYLISFDVKAISGTPVCYVYATGIGTLPGGSGAEYTSITTDAWKTYTTILNVTTSKHDSPVFYPNNESAYIDNISIKRITKGAVTPEPPAPTEYAVTINTDANAITSVAAATSEGEAVNFTAKPKFGYYIASITIGGEAFTGFDAYKGGVYTTGAIAADTAIVVTVAELADNTEEGVATEVATLPSVFAPAADSAVTFGKVLDTTNATSWGVELTKDGVGVTPANGGSYLYKANATNANGQYAIEFIGLDAGTYQIRSYIYVDGTAVFGAPTTFVVD